MYFKTYTNYLHLKYENTDNIQRARRNANLKDLKDKALKRAKSKFHLH